MGRGVAAASVATFVATLSHAAVGGELPPFVNVVLALCLAAPLCVMLAGRSLSWTRLALAVILSQALFHALLVLDLRGGGVSGGHHMMVALMPAPTVHGPAVSADSPWMWAAHALAAAVTILAIGRGERTARAVARFFVRVLRRALRRDLNVGPTDAAGPTPAPLLLPRALAVLSPMRHRGPPRAA